MNPESAMEKQSQQSTSPTVLLATASTPPWALLPVNLLIVPVHAGDFFNADSVGDSELADVFLGSARSLLSRFTTLLSPRPKYSCKHRHSEERAVPRLSSTSPPRQTVNLWPMLAYSRAHSSEVPSRNRPASSHCRSAGIPYLPFQQSLPGVLWLPID